MSEQKTDTKSEQQQKPAQQAAQRSQSQVQPIGEQTREVQRWFSSPAVTQQIAAALPKVGITADRMARLAMTEVRRTPKLALCSIESLLGAVMQCAQYGLEPGPAGLAYLIPYGKEAQFQLGYKGLLALAWRSKQISSVQAQVVRAGDRFEYGFGIPPKLEHEPAKDHGERGEVTHVYAVIGTTSGGWVFDVMSYEEVEEHRKQHAQSGSSPWKQHWEMMARKTVLKRACKYAPMSTELQRAIVLDDAGELGIPQEIDVTPPEAPTE